MRSSDNNVRHLERNGLFADLFRRHDANPILTALEWPYPVHSVFNPGATRLPDGSTILLCRCEDRRGFSHLTVARSDNGVDGWKIDSKPTFQPDPHNCAEELWGVEDPRITYMEDLKAYVIAYTAFSKDGPGVSLMKTKDFKKFQRICFAMQPDDKDAALFPKKIDGQYALIHRPMSDMAANMWISYSPDLKSWGGHKLLLPARRGAWWDANKIGLNTPPIETKDGWLVIYHGVRRHASGSLYRLGLALFDLENPEVCLLRGQDWIMAPDTIYEREGDVPNVVFPCGITIANDEDTVRLYYGAADSCICLAVGSIKEMLAWLKDNGTAMVGVAGTLEEKEIMTTMSHAV
jgi:predicted GH43/DUF377 family glycosyl hydrolase